MRIAVLLTCHNRKEKTLAFLRSLVRLEFPQDAVLDVYLNDDGSTDGTGEAVRAWYQSLKPSITLHLLQGSGADYWCGGMRRAWNAAVQGGGYDYYLWANDDVVLESDAIMELLSIAADSAYAPVGVVCGSFCDPKTGDFTYGGRSAAKLLKPNGTPQKCRYIHGNTVLVPRATFARIGGFDPRWTHGFGDTDYGLMCIEAGLNCLTTSKYIGTCEQHQIKGPWLSSKVPFRKRWELMWKPVGGAFREFVIFRRKHHPYRWVFDAVKFFVQVLFPRPFEWARR